MVEVRLGLVDNRYGDSPNDARESLSKQVPDVAKHEPVYRLLSKFSGKKLSEWESLGCTVYSANTQGLAVEDDRAFDKLSVFSVSGESAAPGWINTHNCMGVVRLRGEKASVQLEIKSRFDQGQQQYFLNYLLCKVFGGSMVEEVELGGDSMWDMLLAFVFRRKLEEACRVGIFKQYQRFEHNDLRFRGKFNMDEHLRRNVPFAGKLAYTTRDITFDNPVNHLLRHTIAKVTRKWGGILSGSKELTDFRHQLEQNTPGWQSGQVLPCIRDNLRPVKHPYFQACYEPLRQIALSLLREVGAGLYSASQEAEGVLFDGAWLWESYLWTLLQPLGFSHPDNTKREGEWTILKKDFYPDFFFDSSEPRIVLDAKYKKSGLSGEDIQQVLAYMFMLNAKVGGLIKPEGSETEPEDITWKSEKRGTWHNLFVHIPEEAKNARDFNESMKKEQEELTSKIKKLLS